MEQCEGGIREGGMEVRLEGEGLHDLRGDESLSTIVCSCGKEFHLHNRNSSANFRHHLRKNSGHREILRFSFKDPRKMEVVYKSEDRYVPTPDDLAKAMAYLYSKDGMILKEEDLRDTAIQVMQFLGFEKEVVGNHLEQDEIALMYQLEDVGLVDTRIEEYNLLDGNPWEGQLLHPQRQEDQGTLIHEG